MIHANLRAEIVEVYLRTRSMQKTARELGLGYGSVQRALVEEGVPRRSYGGEKGETKTCRVCGEDKSLSEFVLSGRVGKKNTCDDCRADERRFRIFGISAEQYAEMLRRQGGRCAICRREPDKMRLSVDHDHETGQVRGLLCNACNVALGYAREDVEVLAAMIEYVEEWS